MLTADAFAVFDAQSQLDVGEYQNHPSHTPASVFVDDLLVAFNAEVVGDTHRANRWVRRLDGIQERCFFCESRPDA